MDERRKQVKFAESQHNTGWTLSLKGDDDEALGHFHSSLEIREHWLGKTHTDTAKTYYQIASCLHNQKKVDECLVFYRRAYQAWEVGVGEEHSHTQQTQLGIKQALETQGMDADSIQEYLDGLKDAVEKRKSGNVYHQRGDCEQASWEYQMALALQESAIGQFHPDTADLYCDLAGVFKDFGDYDQAISEYQTAGMIYRDSLGEDHPTVARINCEIADILVENEGDSELAEMLYQNAYAIYSNSLGCSHPDTIRAFTGLRSLGKEKPRPIEEESPERAEYEEMLLCGCCQVNRFSADSSSLSVPVMSRACGHSICRSCVERLTNSKCPLCNAALAFCKVSYSVNRTLCDMIALVDRATISKATTAKHSYLWPKKKGEEEREGKRKREKSAAT